MEQEKSIIEEVKQNICDECRTCTVAAVNKEGEKFTIIAGFCDDGSAYITLDLYNSNNEWLDTCKLKDWTDTCSLPFNLIPDPEPDCDCI